MPVAASYLHAGNPPKRGKGDQPPAPSLRQPARAHRTRALRPAAPSARAVRHGRRRAWPRRLPHPARIHHRAVSRSPTSCAGASSPGSTRAPSKRTSKLPRRAPASHQPNPSPRRCSGAASPATLSRRRPSTSSPNPSPAPRASSSRRRAPRTRSRAVPPGAGGRERPPPPPPAPAPSRDAAAPPSRPRPAPPPSGRASDSDPGPTPAPGRRRATPRSPGRRTRRSRG